MTNEQLIAFLENQIRLLEKAFEESDGMMVGVARHEVFEYIGPVGRLFIQKGSAERDREENPFHWSENYGTAIALDPIRSEIDAMKEMVKTLKGGNNG